MWRHDDSTSGERNELRRRRFLGASLAVATGVFAGCAGPGDDEEEEDDGDEDDEDEGGGGYSLDRSR